MSTAFKNGLRSRGLVSAAFADANPNELLAQLSKTFEEFKTENDANVAKINGRVDTLQTEKIDRINTHITDLDVALKEATARIDAMRVGGSGDADDPAVKEHTQAFNKFFRKGVDNNLQDLEVKAKLTTQSDPDGGYLVPHETETQIDRVLGVNSVMRQIANVMQLGAESYSKFVNQGGATSGWVGEEEERTETATPTLRELVFNMMEIYAEPATTQRMLDSGIIDISAWLADEVQVAFSEAEGLAHITGDGNKKPRGLLSYEKVANNSYAWGKLGFIASGKSDGFTSAGPADAFIDTYYALKQGHRSNASWLMSDATMGKVRKFKDADGAYIWAPPSSTASVATILGKPVYTDDNMPAVAANAFPIAFGDFNKGYLIVDGIGIRIIRDAVTQKGKVLFYTTKRTGGGISNFEALKLMKIST